MLGFLGEDKHKEITWSGGFQNQCSREFKLLTTLVSISSKDLSGRGVHLSGPACKYNRIGYKYCKRRFQNDLDNLEKWSEMR